jgi:hypothetical protein
MQKQMSIIVLIIVFSFIVITGCKSSLSYKVSIYDTSGEEVRTEYEKHHPPSQGAVTVVSRYYELKELEASVTQFENNLIALNALVKQVPLVTIREPDNATVTMLRKQADDITGIIKEAFSPLKIDLSDEIKRLDDILRTGGQLYAAPKLHYDFETLWNDTLLRLREERQVVVDPRLAQTTIKQLLPLVQNPAEIKKMASKVAGTDVDQSRIEAILQELGRSSARPDQALKDLTASLVEKPDEQITKAAGRITQTGPSRIQRRHIVIQDMSDPFIPYIAMHPENWKDVPNTAHVCGDGDADFILVYDDMVDARWKTIQLDPTAVIQARLRVSRVAAKAVAAIAGSLAASYGIPIPAAMTNESKQESIDFSVMTAEGEYLRQMNNYLAGRLASLRDFAQENAGRVNAKNVDSVTGQLRRRLSELKIPPEKEN